MTLRVPDEVPVAVRDAVQSWLRDGVSEAVPDDELVDVCVAVIDADGVLAGEDEEVVDAVDDNVGLALRVPLDECVALTLEVHD